MCWGILFELLLVYTLPNPDLCSAGTASTTEKPILLNNIADAEAFTSSAEVAVIGFFQVCSQHSAVNWQFILPVVSSIAA